jgi:DNA polymerase III epsilon subunit-like protein
MTATLAFLDTETTGLDPNWHEVWEVGLILRQFEDVQGKGWRAVNTCDTEHLWQLPVDLGRAEPIALTIGNFYERRGLDANGMKNIQPPELGKWARDFARLTHGAHLVGAVPSFDDAFLKRLLKANGACAGWHYHLVDVEALAAGFARGRGRGMAIAGDVTRFPGAVAAYENAAPPWTSDDLSKAVGVDPGQFDRHTALGDARWARAIYDAVMTAGPKPSTTR